MESHPLSPLLQAYWHLLMYYNNKAAVQAADGLWYWPVRFNVPNTTLMARLRLKNRQAVWAQRQTLIRAERLTYTPGIGSRAGQYSMIPFDKGLAAVSVASESRPGPTLVWTQTAPPARPGAQPYINPLNPKPASLFYGNQEATPFMPQFNLLPQISEDEKAAIRAQYPGDEVGAFNAIWEAREKKQRGETP
nr:restriction endonuclease subunit S [Eubacterium sp. 1001713B170207_170306_E7]